MSIHHPPRPPTLAQLSSTSRTEFDTNGRTITPYKPNHSLTNNSIITSKYTPLTFIPRNLFEQFHRIPYVYFLAIVVLNQLPQLAVFSRAASILPLAFVLIVTAAKDAYEDYRRHLSDKVENSRTVTVVEFSGQFRFKQWKDILVGDVVKIKANETLPCDIVLLSTSDATGVAYAQAINLDGESNLKTRYAKQETMEMSSFETVVVNCENPSRNIYGFEGFMEVEGRRVSLGPSNVVLRGCEVNNTEWIVGVAVYTGSETKVMMNSSGAQSKRSRLEVQMNRETLLLSVVLIVICAIVSVFNGVWLSNHREELELAQFFHRKDYSNGDVKNYNYYGIGMNVFLVFLMAVIVFQTMVPISLYISMELVRLGQAYFMARDLSMFDESSGSMLQCRALNINEDLGQIKYVFSDKTGTLTENKMVFQCASIGGIDYSGGRNSVPDNCNGISIVVGNQVWKPKMSVKTDPELVQLLRNERGSEERNRAYEFFLALAACNTIVPMVVETQDAAMKMIEYQGESPDEQALVCAAAAYGFVLMERTSGYIVIDVLGNRQRFNVLGLHEFDSDRKRMSVIIGCPDGTLKLFAKGADSSMFGVLDRNIDSSIIKATEANLQAYSTFGLRTLVIGMRELDVKVYDKWQSSYEKASTALSGRGTLLRAVAAKIESDLHILGASAIEDKLQQGVPEAIESLRQAGIKVWVLTGDKQETALSIGYSCKLLTNKMTQIVINSNSKEVTGKSLEDAVAMSRKLAAISRGSLNSSSGTLYTKIALALIIEGASLVHILDSELEDELFKVAIICDVVLCCRVAPFQKAGIVELIKKRTNDMTLAIGDGANDVSMIQRADVGIGISGQEGRQAVMASDFAMGQFRFLVPLLLVHGHWNYQRMTYLILYNFYRNAIFIFLLFWYVLYTAFTLTTAITDWSSVLYSVIYTSLPTIVVGVLDKDVSRRTLLKYQQLYGTGQRGEKYNLKLFILTITDSIWQSLVVFYIPYLAYRHGSIDASSMGDLWTLAVVILVNIHLAMDVFRWNWIIHASIWGSIVATIACVMVIDCIPILPGYMAIFNIINTREFWLCLFSTLVVALLPRFTAKAMVEYLAPNDIQVAREEQKFRNMNVPTNLDVPLDTFSQPI